MSELAKAKRGRKRTTDEVKEYFSRKMAWLTQRCRDPFITDAQFRVLYSLVVNWLHKESDWCKPTDKKLGESCAKGERTVQRITAELRDEHIDKQKQLGPSQYVFIGLTDTDENEATPANLAGYEDVPDKSTPANLGSKTRHIGSEDPPPVGRTKPSYLLSDLPTDSDGFAAVSENKKEGNQEELVERLSPHPKRPAEPIYVTTFWGTRLCEASKALESEKDPARRAELQAKIVHYEAKLKEAVNA